MLDVSQDLIKTLVLLPYGDHQWLASVTLISQANEEPPVVFSAAGTSAQKAVRHLAQVLREQLDSA